MSAFRRVLVDFMVKGTTRVTWDLARHFLDPDPDTWTYTLQVSLHGQLPTYQSDETTVRSDDWVDVGTPLVNISQLTDTTQRARGKLQTTAYRVKLVTPAGTYYSSPATTLGLLDVRDWLLAQEMVRKELLLARVGTAVPGFLLRRKREGTPCSKCLDPNTGAVRLGQCNVCKGTRYIAGYFAAVPLYYAEIEPLSFRETTDEKATGPALTGLVSKGRVLAAPGVYSHDIWVDGQADQRYVIHTVTVLAQIRHVPLVLEVEMRQIEYDDVAYTLSLS